MTCTGLPSNQEERQGRGRWQTLTCSKGLRGKCYVLGCFSCCYTCMYTIRHGHHLQKQTTATNSQNLQKSGFLFRWYSTVVKKSLITAIISAKNIVIGLLGHVASSWWIWGQKHRETAGRWDHVGHQPVETVQTNDLRAQQREPMLTTGDFPIATTLMLQKSPTVTTCIMYKTRRK